MHVAFLVCHVDDAVLGAGGTAQRILEAGHTIDVVYVTEDYNYHPEKNYDNREEARQAWKVLGLDADHIHFLDFPTMKLDTEALIDVNIAFEETGLEPDVIITLDQGDVNQDHWTAYNSAMIVGRSIDRQIGIVTMEVLSSTEWGEGEFRPNYYVNVDGKIGKKIQAMEKVESELETWPHPRSPKGIETKAQQRGMEVGYDYAEAFRLVRWFDFEEQLV